MRYINTLAVSLRQVKLRLAIARLGRLASIRQRLRHVLRHAIAAGIHQRKIGLRGRKTRLRGGREQLDRPAQILLRAMALVIQAGQQMLPGRITGIGGGAKLPVSLGVITVVISEDARFIQRFGRRCHRNSFSGDFFGIVHSTVAR